MCQHSGENVFSAVEPKRLSEYPSAGVENCTDGSSIPILKTGRRDFRLRKVVVRILQPQTYASMLTSAHFLKIRGIAICKGF